MDTLPRGSARDALVEDTAVYVGLGLAREVGNKVWWIFAAAGILCAVISIILNPYRDKS